MNAKLNTIFSKSGCPEEGVLQKYLKGELTHDQRHEVEKHLIDCEMCSDELEGLRLMNDPKRLNVVVGRINSRIDEKFKIRQIRPFSNFLRIAAVVLAFIVVGSLIMLYNHYNKNNTKNYLAENVQKDSVSEQQQESTEATAEKIDTTPQEVEEIFKSSENLIAQNQTKVVLEEKQTNAPVYYDKSNENTGVLSNDNFEFDEIAKLDDQNSDSIYSENFDKNAVVTGYSDSSINDLAMNEEVKDEEKESVNRNAAAGASVDNIKAIETKKDRSENKKAKAAKLSTADETIVMAPTSTSADSDIQQKTESLQLDGISNYDNLLNLAMDDYTTEKYDDAKDKLEQILKDNNFTYYQKAQWYYALTLIKLNNKSKPKKVLTQIIDTSNHQYANEAKVKLLELTDGN